MDSPERLVAQLQAAVQEDPFWRGYLTQLGTAASSSIALHLAIFVEPYLQFVLEGLKTVESRFSVGRYAPYGQVGRGDVIVLKRSGGPIVGLCQVADVWFYRLDPASWQTIRTDFTQALCAQDPQFWQARAHATCATLMRIKQVRAVPPLPYTKRDRRGWVVLQSAPTQLGFEGL